MAERSAVAVRIGASLALLLFAGLAAASGFDRMSQHSPGVARLVPDAMRTHAARAEGAQAIARGAPEAALAATRAAVAADPVHPGSTALLGTAHLLARDDDAAEAAFRVAARFGWREASTQLYWYEAAIQAGDLSLAVDRADAVLRVHPTLPERGRLLEPLESSPQGRAALIARLDDRPIWLGEYLRLAQTIEDEALDRRSLVLAELAAAGTRLGCTAVAPFVTTALARGARAQAEAVWLGHCPGASVAGGLADGGFERLASQDPSPFGWQIARAGDVSVRAVARSEGRAVLRMRNRASVSRLVLRQALSLEPGTYRLTGTTAPDRVAGSLGCGQLPPLPSLTGGDLASEGQILRVPECSRLELGLWLRPGPDEVELDDVRLERIG